MYTLDVSVIMRSFDHTDPNQATCQHLLDRLEALAVPVLVPRLLLAELGGALRRLTNDPIRARLGVAAWQRMPHVQLLTLTDDLLDAAAELAGDYALRGADALYVVVARQHGATLVSLDREQRERAAPVVRALTPAEALAELP